MTHAFDRLAGDGDFIATVQPGAHAKGRVGKLGAGFLMTFEEDSSADTTEWNSGERSELISIAPGTAMGRYVIIEPIGSGGMGTVYRAYDPELNRGIALKILSVKQTDEQAAARAKSRLIREAQALAKLSHPNVVAIHDVGSFGDDVFIAMELVEGNTLKDWLGEKRPTKKILEIMIAAGRGLAAAHKTGLVHRDFKPHNVIVGDDERVRVLDFGLARAVNEAEDPNLSEGDTPDEIDINSSWNSNLLQTPLTKEGGIIGTPLYMAPEQILGQKTDERTDQFAFCLVLYEALWGKRPFAAKTMKELKGNVIEHRLTPPPKETDVPTWLWPIIQKGLQKEPQDRHPDMDSLLHLLGEDPDEIERKRRLDTRRKFYLLLLLVLIIAGPGGVWYGLRYRTVRLCKSAETEFFGVWDKPTKLSLQRSFLATKEAFAAETWKRVERIFNRYLTDWTHMRAEICEAKLIRATQSEELFDLRMRCLGKRVRDLKALVKVLRQIDSQILQKAVQASSSLPSIAICADEDSLRAPYPLPDTADAKSKVIAIREKLAEVEAYTNTGKYLTGLDLVKKLERNANAINYRPIQAEVFFQLGLLLERAGEYAKSEIALLDAARVAGQSKDALLAAKALVWLVRVVGYQQARYDAGLSIANDAKVVLDIAGNDKMVRAQLINNIGVMYSKQGEYDKALGFFRESMAIQMNVLGAENPNVAQQLSNLGALFFSRNDYDSASRFHQQALAIRKKTLGPKHPDVATSLYNLGIVYSAQGEDDKSLTYFRQALDLWQNAQIADHPHAAYALMGIGEVLRKRGEYSESLKHYQRALEINQKALGAQHPKLVWQLSYLGEILLEQKKPQAALQPLERAVKICQTRTCDPNPYYQALFFLGQALVSTNGDKSRALKLVKQARQGFCDSPNFENSLKRIDAWLKKVQGLAG